MKSLVTNNPLHKHRRPKSHAGKTMADIKASSHVPPAKSAPKEYVFVEVAKTGRVTNKKQLHTVRKHIMKDIGKSRRKHNRYHKEPQQKAKSNNPQALERASPDSSSTDSSDRSIPRAWSLGSGRTDPFACYPIPADKDLLFLIDHGTPKSHALHLERY